MTTITVRNNMHDEVTLAVTDDLRALARHYRDTHAAYKASEDREPAVDGEGMPFDRVAWLLWYDAHKPLAEARKAAAVHLRAAANLGTLHPWTLDPAADAILNGKDATR